MGRHTGFSLLAFEMCRLCAGVSVPCVLTFDFPRPLRTSHMHVDRAELDAFANINSAHKIVIFLVFALSTLDLLEPPWTHLCTICQC